MVEMKLLRWKDVKLEKEAVTKMKIREFFARKKRYDWRRHNCFQKFE